MHFYVGNDESAIKISLIKINDDALDHYVMLFNKKPSKKMKNYDVRTAYTRKHCNF